MNQALKTGTNKNNISFSDYYYKTKGDIPLTLDGYGSGLNNIPENITKLILTAKFFDNQLVAQINTQLYWSFDGSYDEMKMYQQAYDNFNLESLTAEESVMFSTQKAEFENERALLDKSNAYKFNYTVNMSVTYHWAYEKDIDMSLSFFVENITNSRKTYYVSTGSTNYYPNRLKYMEQPMTIGVNFGFSY